MITSTTTPDNIQEVTEASFQSVTYTVRTVQMGATLGAKALLKVQLKE